MVGVVLFGDIPGEQPAAQAADLEPVQVAQGTTNDGRGRMGGRLQAVHGEDLEGLRGVLVNHHSQGIIRRRKMSGRSYDR